MHSLQSLVRHARIFGMLLALTPLVAASQVTPGRISGTVQTETGRPLQDAIVVLDPELGVPQRVSTDVNGRFRFDRVSRGSHALRTISVGYERDDRTIEMGASGVEITISLRRLPFALDTLRIVARQTAIIGTVIARAEFKPLSRANVTVMEIRGTKTTGPDGKFEFPGLKERAYVVHAKAGGFLPRMLSVFVPADSTVEIALTLDSLSVPGAKALVQPLEEFDRRVRFMARARAALVTRHEMAEHPRMGVGDALRWAPSYMKTGMILDDNVACIWVNGRPRPGAIANDFDVSEVETVEVYGLRADWTETLGAKGSWPPGIPCGRPEPSSNARPSVTSGGAGSLTGLQRGPGSVNMQGPSASRRVAMDSYVRAVVIWLKR